MPLLNFTKWKAEKVRELKARMTIRKQRKIPIKPGDKLFLFQGLRTKYTEPIYLNISLYSDGIKTTRNPFVICSSVSDIEINVAGVFVDGKKLKSMQRLALALSDGFDNIHDFLEFFRSRYGDNFKGQIIRW